VAALGLAVGCTYTVRNTALARGWARLPDSDRHVHTTAIPRLGGVAILLTFGLITALFLTYARIAGLISPQNIKQLAFLLVPAMVVFSGGLYDDFRSATPWLKFGTQIVAGALLFTGGFRVALTPRIAYHHGGWLATLILTIFWTVLITNAFNLIDGLDGLAAGSALFSTLAMFVVALVMHNGTVALLTAVLAGATVGFLRYNFNPATIFLGDCGSQFLGFMLAALSLIDARQQKSSTIIAIAIPLLAFGFPIVEATISVLRRLISGQPIFTADRQHIHHKLMARGLSHRSAVVLLYVVSAAFSLLSLPLLSPGAAPIAIVLAIVGIGITVGVQHLRYHEFFEIGRIARRTLDQPQVIVNNLLVRRASEALWTAADLDGIRSALHTAFAHTDFDAFELQLSSRHYPALSLSHEWNRSAARQPLFNLTLDLLHTDGSRLGALVLKRDQQSPLLMDINLLSAELIPALAAAGQRVLHPLPEPPVPELGQKALSTAAASRA
jgi:UDP-GlcNAc:undecaprenyl-phosphate GlcNAc-1-phosphate transferase